MRINTYNKENLTFIEITNDAHLMITFCNLGASIFEIVLDDKIMTRNARNISDFKRPDCYYGKTIGRTANRIKGNIVKIGDEPYILDVNEGANVLHGGPDGLSNKIFDHRVDNKGDKIVLSFTYLSPDGEGGYPGNAEITVKYEIYLKKARFDLIFEAISDKDTLMSLTNHTYFHMARNLDELELKIDSHKFLDVDDELIGREIKKMNNIMEFLDYRQITQHIDHSYLGRDRLKGYDHFYYFRKPSFELNNVSLRSDEISLDIYSDFEGVQIYTSNHLAEFELAPECYGIRDAIAIEPSDSHFVLHPLKAGEKYSRHISYRFRHNNWKYESIVENFENKFNAKPQEIFSCGGRFEILGNHTDHNHGLCLAATCNLAISAGISKTDSPYVMFHSKEYDPDVVSLNTLTPVEEEKTTSKALIRGVASYLVDHGYKVGGFNGYSESTIFSGAGVSSSAAFELLVGQIFNDLYNDGRISKLELAKAGKYAENVFFGKASGLLDQIGVGYGNIAYIDFKDVDNPVVEEIPFPFDDLHFVIINTGGSHAKLSHLYSAIPEDMYNAAHKAGVNYLRETTFENLPHDLLTESELGRSIHFYSENERVRRAVDAIKNKDEATFLAMINESRVSSTENLKNMMVADQYEGSPLEACDLFMEVTEGKGAIKINGGGFAGSVIAVVNTELLPLVLKVMGNRYGKSNVVEVFVREKGPCKE